MTEHTKLPWEISEARTTDGTFMVVGGEGRQFGLIADVTTDVDAAYIVKACNAFQDLVKALEQIADMDPHGIRADDLGRAARIAHEAIITAVKGSLNHG